MRRKGIEAAASALAVRRMMRSWKEKRSSPRRPLPGRTWPARISARMREREIPTSPTRSFVPKACMSRPGSSAALHAPEDRTSGLRPDALPSAPGGFARRGALRRSLGRLARLEIVAGFCAAGLDALAQHFHQVDHVAARGRRRRFRQRDLLALDLLLNGRLDPAAELIHIGGWLEALGGLLLDELP